MRISDWSSDVCSSDLVRITPDADGASLEITDWRTRPLVQPHTPPISEVAVVPQSWTWECDQQLRIVALRAAPDAPPVPEGWEGCRSEEHTSELQSLMRISYAVFCLKKKNIYIEIKKIEETTNIVLHKT